MFVRDSAACAQPNSATPMSQAAIDAQNRRVARTSRHFTDGDNTLNDLILAMGGNPFTQGTGDSGVPTVGVPYFGLPVRGGGPTSIHHGDQSQPCVFPEVLPLVTVFPVLMPPPNPQPGPGPTYPLIDHFRVPPPVQVPSGPSPCDNVTPENVCKLARDGCFNPNQLSPEQRYACSWAGWQGNFNMYPQVLLAGGAQGGRNFGSLNLCPANPVGESMPCPPSRNMQGLSGLSDDAQSGFMIAAASVFGLFVGNEILKAFRKGKR
jgi:hypothetical protein